MCLAAFFGVIIAVNIFMATLASSSWTGLVVKNSYVASQKFNGKLQGAEEQKKRGWRSSIEFQHGEFKIRLFDKTGETISLSKAQLFVGRPAFEQQDQLVELVEQSNGSYLAKLPLGIGEWAIKITGDVDALSYRRDERMTIDAAGLGKIRGANAR